MARKKGIDINFENDKLLRAGLSALYKETKKAEIKKELLKDEGTKAQFMKFLFNESDFNPLQ
jgi:hypothetical protein